MAIRPRGRHGTAGAAALLTLALLAACSSDPGEASAPPGAETLQTIIDAPDSQPELEIGGPVADSGYGLDRYAVSYESEGLTITGLLALPVRDSLSPGLVVIHGYERGTYDAMTSMGSYYAPLVEAGYVVLFPDLRNYGGSDGDPAAWDDMNMSGTRDAANAVRALATLPQVDPERLGVVGLSEGGRLALTTSVVVPDLLDAVVSMSPTSADAWDNVERFMSAGVGPDGFLGLGTPQAQPAYWEAVNPGTFADRTSAPLLVVQALADETCDPAWGAAAAETWLAAGKDATLLPIEGASHVYEGQVEEVMAQVVDFLDVHVG
jgi:dipeptidyl aminopeptidase/acylaminoacyl peptidase